MSKFCKQITMSLLSVITHAGSIAAGVGRAFSRVCLFVCLFVCLSVSLTAL